MLFNCFILLLLYVKMCKLLYNMYTRLKLITHKSGTYNDTRWMFRTWLTRRRRRSLGWPLPRAMYPVWDVVPRDLQPGRDCTFRVKPLPLNKGGGAWRVWDYMARWGRRASNEGFRGDWNSRVQEVIQKIKNLGNKYQLNYSSIEEFLARGAQLVQIVQMHSFKRK